MAQRWSFEEDYAVCMFAFEYAYENISDRELECLARELEERGLPIRSRGAIDRRVRAYQCVFTGEDSCDVTNTINNIALAYMNRIEDSARIEKINKCIAGLSDQQEDGELLDYPSMFALQNKQLHNFVDLEPSAPSFKDLLISHMKKRGLTETEVYKGAFVSRDKFSHIINGRKGKNIKSDKNAAHVSQRIAMQLCIGLKLSYEEAVYFMSCAGHAFYPNEDIDRVVVACLKHRICNIVEVNMELYDRNLELFKEPDWRTGRQIKE